MMAIALQILDAKLSDFVAYLADQERAEHFYRPFKPGQFEPRTVPAPVAEHPSDYLADLRNEAHTIRIELIDYAEQLAQTEQRESVAEKDVIDLTVGEP